MGSWGQVFFFFFIYASFWRTGSIPRYRSRRDFRAGGVSEMRIVQSKSFSITIIGLQSKNVFSL